MFGSFTEPFNYCIFRHLKWFGYIRCNITLSFFYTRREA